MKEQSKYSDMLMFSLLLIILVVNVKGDPLCPPGTYGDSCDKNCSDHCSVFPGENIVYCDKISGSCSEGCTPGWYDAKCNKACSKNCINNICNHQDGVCTSGCKDGKKGNHCEVSEEEHDTKGKESTTDPSRTPIAAIVATVLVIIFIIPMSVLLVYFIRRKYYLKRQEYMAVSCKGIWEATQNRRGIFKRPTADTPLYKASADGDLGLVKQIMSTSSADVNTRGLFGLTPLMLAAQKGNYDVFEFLHSNGADMEHIDPDGNHILSIACVGGNMDIVKYVNVKEPSLINKKRRDGRTPLMWAAWHGKITMFHYLRDNGADILLKDNDGDNILHYACYGGHIGIVRDIINNTTIGINSIDRYGRTALMVAAKYGHKDVFDFLLGKGSNISHVDHHRNTMLHAACRGGHTEVVNTVIANATIDIKSSNRSGRTAVMVAAEHGHIEVFDLLVRQGINLSHTDKEGDNILHVACRVGHVEMVEHVLSTGNFDINCRGQYGGTPLMVATFGGHKDVFDLLVRKGADVSLVGTKGNNILHVACMGGHEEMVKHILSRGMVDINSHGHKGMTSLMWAARRGHREVFHLLVSKGADLSQTDHKGNNILHLACELGNMEIVQDVLSQNNLDINSKNGSGKTASMIAKRTNDVELYVLLINKTCVGVEV